MIPGNPQHEYETPAEVFEPLAKEFRFSIDAAATKDNKKCHLFFGRSGNGLRRIWDDQVIWCHPPGVKPSQLKDWIIKAQQAKRSTVVMLLPFKHTSKWFHRLIIPSAHEIRLFNRKLKFGPDHYPMPYFIAIWRPTKCLSTRQPLQVKSQLLLSPTTEPPKTSY